uniref:LACS9 n=1 Tax=Arundo donax TaxID=35708 RepID=A0A0A9EP68_ARUDO
MKHLLMQTCLSHLMLL